MRLRGVVAVALCAVDQGAGEDGFVVDDDLCAVAVGIEAEVVVHVHHRAVTEVGIM